MKNSYIIIAVIVVVTVLAFVFGTRDKMPEVASPEVKEGTTTALTDGTYKINLEKSTIKVTAEYLKGPSEEGTLSLASGSLMVASGQPFTGTFDIDLSSLSADSNLVLENYVKGKEFLDVDNYPTATFVIRSVTSAPNVATSTGKYIIEGKLTVKDKVSAISFPLVVSQDGRTIFADSSFAINRADWGLGNNEEIRNAVLLDIHIEATK